jgi:hypothetical protein
MQGEGGYISWILEINGGMINISYEGKGYDIIIYGNMIDCVINAYR